MHLYGTGCYCRDSAASGSMALARRAEGDDATMPDVGDARIDRERIFHNERFVASDSYRSQNKYYAAVRSGSRKYRNIVYDLAKNSDVLEYGCAVGTVSVSLSPVCRSITGIDISDVAIQKATRHADLQGAKNANFFAMNAERMTFPDNSFDLVFGSGIIHHLDVERSLGEISRVLRPGGQAVFWEPLGCNPIINFYRRSTPQARTPDEHPLRPADMDLAKKYFADVDLDFYGFFTLASVPLRNSSAFAPAYRFCRLADRLVFSLPGLKWAAWFALIHLKKGRRESR